MVDVINDGCPIADPLLTESSAVEIEQEELQEDSDLKMIHKFQVYKIWVVETSSRKKNNLN